MSNPHVFVTGCARSGTTLLQRMLDSHPQLAVSNDTHVVPRPLLRLNPSDPQLPLTPALVEQVVGYKRFVRFGIERERALQLAAGSPTFADFVRRLFAEFAHLRSKPFVGEKVPYYVRFLPLLSRLFPESRTIQIVRDGRDVALSALEWIAADRFLRSLTLWSEEPIAVCALWWRRQVTAGQRGSAAVGADRCHVIRYEDLVRTPEPVIRSITAFLDLPFDARVLDYNNGRTRQRPGLSSKGRWLPPTSGLRDWRDDLTPRDLALFEALAGDALQAHGYPLASEPVVAQRLLAVAEGCRRHWESEVPDA